MEAAYEGGRREEFLDCLGSECCAANANEWSQ